MNKSSSVPVGVKFDEGKTEYGLLPPFALEEVASVLTKNIGKYDRENWRYVDHLDRRYFDAAQRHQWANKRGELLDPDSKKYHLAHAICNLMFKLEKQIIGDEKWEELYGKE